MKSFYTLLVALLCWTAIQAQEHEYVPMLREDLTWVGWFNGANVYCIKVKGDTIVNGTTYKKCYRIRQDGHYMQYQTDYPAISYYYTDPYVPASCMREENGKVFRLCEKGNEHIYSFMPDFPNYTSERYNETDTHYELLIYDFDNPNIYRFNYNETDLVPCGNVEVEGEQRRVYINNHGECDHRLLIEGYGALEGGSRGCDMLEPSRYNYPAKIVFSLDIIYIRNDKGEVIYFRDILNDPDPDPDSYDDGYGNYFPRYYRDAYDFDDDGSFDIADVNAMINIMLGKREDNILGRSPDLTFDQSVDVEDLNLVLNRMLSNIKHLKYSEIDWPGQ